MYLTCCLVYSSVSSATSKLLNVLEVGLFLTVMLHFATVQSLRNYEERKVTWVLMTHPVVFGEDAKLTCVINDKNMPCSKDSNRMWEGGPGRNLLLLNGVSSDHEKYREESQNPCLNFSLVIKSITEFDVGCEYKCSVGFEESKQNELSVNNTDFISIPNNKSTHSLTISESAIDLIIMFYRIYPLPQCKMVSGLSRTDVEVSTETRSDMFYDITLNATQALAFICSYCWKTVTVTVYCNLLRMNIFNLTETFNCSNKLAYTGVQAYCIEGTQTSATTNVLHRLTNTLVYILVVVPIVAAVCVCLVFGISRKMKLFTRRTRDNDIELRTTALLVDA